MRIPVRRGWAVAALVVPFVVGTAGAGEVKEREPDARGSGTLYEWHAEDGLAYQYRVPASYDEEKGTNLTLILHGSNLDRRWGFANHDVKTFRPDDLVVSPDGTTSNGQGGFNFLGEAKDAKRLARFVEELRGRFRIRHVYLYGHSQGSFFAFYFAGEYPDVVNGVVGHASGVWTWTQGGKKGHHQAIALMHGTQDPVVPYGQSVGGYEWFEELGYPTLRLVSLEGWNHWPAEHNGPVPHTSQELAWAEGMTEIDPERLAACLAFLSDAKSKERHDYAALYQVAKRIEGMADLAEDLRGKAAKAAAAVEDLARLHAAEFPEPTAEFEEEPWVGHLPMFLRAFGGVPACDEVAAAWAKVLDKHQKAIDKYMRKYWQALQKGDKADAFVAGVDALEAGFLHFAVTNGEFLENLATWEKEARALKIPKSALKEYAGVEDYRKLLQEGAKAFDRINRKADL